ncbi:tumor necrosis factor receptor superfamily member 5 isoform X1 [Emys orbicularis]|uniref:tumor necrosis factor receptor superfamily member 5 isoform X1 n=1 Tax=Emys orbicularis TaxID=82168 RepID=UPI0031FD44FE
MLPGSLLCLLGGCLLRHWASGSDLNCTPQEYQHDGRCCNRCAPGLKVRSDCTASRNTECEQCEARHFQSSWTKERHCTPHRSCDHNAGLDTRSPGDTKHNAECQCQQGMYCSSPDCQTCLNITACRPGEGVARKADNFSDTVCVPCEHGSFSNISSTSEPCHLWTSCETLGLVRKVPGTNRLDVACERGRGRFPVLISFMAIIGASLVGLILFCLYQKGLQQHRLKQVRHPAPPTLPGAGKQLPCARAVRDLAPSRGFPLPAHRDRLHPAHRALGHFCCPLGWEGQGRARGEDRASGEQDALGWEPAWALSPWGKRGVVPNPAPRGHRPVVG